MKKMFKVGLALAAAAGMLALMLAGHGGTAHAADTTEQAPQFMVYYRAWRDKEMQGVNTNLPDKNTIAMTDLPTGIDIVNVFSYVPPEQAGMEKQFFDTLKSTYVPAMHARGVKLVRALDYSGLTNISKQYGSDPTDEQFDTYAKGLLHDLSEQWGLDGIDIDMEKQVYETTPAQVKLSDGVVNALSKYIGPKSGNPDTRFIYDTNGTNMNPFQNVKDAFNYLGYQQYGARSNRTARAVAAYEGIGFTKDKFLVGNSFPEEQDTTDWGDTKPDYVGSNIYDIAKYTRENNLGGMFLYAVDRDGRDHDADINSILPTTFSWTKAALEEVKRVTLDQAKAIANYYLDQNKGQWTADQIKTAQETITNGTNIYDVNKAFLNTVYDQSLSPTFDPLAVKKQMEDAAALDAAKQAALANIDAAATAAKVAIDGQTTWSDWAKKTAQTNVDNAVAAAKKAVNGATDVAGANTAATQGVQQIEKAASTRPVPPTPPVQYPDPAFTFATNWVKDATVTQGHDFDPTDGIYAWTNNNYTTKIPVKDWQIVGKVDTSKAGTYTLTYTITNEFSRTATYTRTITVVADTSTKFTDINEIIYVQTTKASQYAYNDQFKEDGKLAGLMLGSAWRTARKAVTGNGDTYYQVGANGWLKASDVTLTTVVDETGIVQVTNDQGAGTVDNLTNGQKVQTLKNGTAWRYTARAGDYYLVADRQWVNAKDVTVTPTPTSGIFKAGAKGAALYNGAGEKQSRTLAAKTEWRITGVKWISGHAYYQVAKDLYVQAADGVIVYNVGKQTVQLYDNQGNTVNAVLGAQTSWRVTSAVSRLGHLYYQVATNRFVRIY
ncbi:immunoglobulin-like domain-containing protein [Schleiferilactobacillus perolens]|uniref:mannosyl-glycoprotein endo-beta-N-acetylglucosaminidase n=1 Tax=Schleiferilactobacillus perolens DSM 12744 TaxID=1423792 RepID=A0A0R1NC69_9LACO|nr:SLAP domain-containing protein [Schleiferilactobacillus perolens]KRL14427.1 endoglycosidase [Schleiferilactobacillus perolens DSM 12744]